MYDMCDVSAVSFCECTVFEIRHCAARNEQLQHTYIARCWGGRASGEDGLENASCNADNSPACVHAYMCRADIPDRNVKLGKCQFEYCEGNYKVGGTKHFNSYIYNGPVLKATTPPPTTTTTTTTTST